MFNEKAYSLGANRSVIRELFEYGRKRTAEVGPENVFDFSLGNPSIPAPPQVEAAIREALAPYAGKTLRVTKAMPTGDILAALENIVSLQ